MEVFYQNQERHIQEIHVRGLIGFRYPDTSSARQGNHAELRFTPSQTLTLQDLVRNTLPRPRLLQLPFDGVVRVFQPTGFRQNALQFHETQIQAEIQNKDIGTQALGIQVMREQVVLTDEQRPADQLSNRAIDPFIRMVNSTWMERLAQECFQKSSRNPASTIHQKSEMHFRNFLSMNLSRKMK